MTCLVPKQATILACSGKDKWRILKLKRQREREGIDEEEKPLHEGTGNDRREDRIQVAMEVKVTKRTESRRPLSRDEEDGDLRMKHYES